MDLPSHHRFRKNLTNPQRQAICEALLKWSQNGKLKKGCLVEVAALFSITVKTVTRIWKRVYAAFSFVILLLAKICRFSIIYVFKIECSYKVNFE